ncbi:MAG: TIGR04086 family membrane protein [Eubacterium sp.]|nr:TIGR04086 family membrane protein [Eubacterium sp.]
MKKIKSSKTDKLLIKYGVKVVLSTALSLLIFVYAFSQLVYKLDLELEINNILSIITVFLCSAVIAFASVYSIKNNGALMGMISEIPLLVFCLFNVIVFENSFILFLVKTVISLLTGALFGIFAAKKSSKFKVK